MFSGITKRPVSSGKTLFSKSSIFIIALQEGFVSIVPYLLISSLGILLSMFFRHYDIRFWIFTPDLIDSISNTLSGYISVIALVAISFRFAIRYNVDQTVAVFLSLAVFFTATAVMTDMFPELAKRMNYAVKLNYISIIIPIVSTLLLKKVLSRIKIETGYMGINIHVYRVFKYVFPFLISYILLIPMVLLLILSGSYIGRVFSQYFFSMPKGIFLISRALLSQLFWFIGIHGPHLVNAFFDRSFLHYDIFPGLSYGVFYRLFAVSGGSGMGLSLLLALAAVKKQKHDIQILKISAPFAVFNINTLLIFGLPVIFNPYLFIPFVFIPVLNTGLAYIFLSLLKPAFSGMSGPWTTPVFVDAYIATGGNYYVIAFQVFLILLGTAIYYPFVKRYTLSQSTDNHLKNIEHKLDIVFSVQAKESLSAYEAQHSIIQSNYELEKIINILDKDSLSVYYQPKVDINTGESKSYEALLRLKLANGEITGPYFLENMEQAGLAPVIDLWVCQAVKNDLDRWAEEGFYPSVGVNLHPDTLQDKETVSNICTLLSGMNVEFEIIERSLLDNLKAREMVGYIRDSGFKIAIDDFGIGHSNFDTITYFDIDSVKLDKSLVEMIHTPRGFTVCSHIVSLCTDLGIECVAEGVETEGQVEELKRAGVNFIQGYIFSKAVPAGKLAGCMKFSVSDEIS